MSVEIDLSSNIVMWTAIVGFFAPVVIAKINNAYWASETKAVVAFAVSALAGAGTAWFSGYYAGRDLVTVALITVMMAIAAYRLFWASSGIAGKLERQ